MNQLIPMIRYLFEQQESALTGGELVARFAGQGEDAEVLERALRTLADLKLTKKISGKRIVPNYLNDTILGELSISRRGSGYVDPIGRGQALSVQIPQGRIGSALPKDFVVAKMDSGRKGSRRRGRPQGVIVALIARVKTQLVGCYQKRGRLAYVEPDEHAETAMIHVVESRVDRVEHGDKVVVELLRPLEVLPRPEGAVVKVFGRDGAPGVDTLAVMHEYGLPTAFGAEVAAEIERLGAEARRSDSDHRRDFRGQLVVTIDPADAKDFDDAVSLRRLGGGGCAVGIHIADVSHYVGPGSAVDAEARRRGTSVYLPTRVVPMLPELLSNDLCSLREGQDRLTKSVVVTFDAIKEVRSFEVTRSVIRSGRRLTYEHAQRLLDAPVDGLDAEERPVAGMLKELNDIAKSLRAKRFAEGSLELLLPEIRVELDAEDRVIGVRQRAHLASHSLIEELMLLANRLVASHFEDHRLVFLRRIHEPPDPEKLQGFAAFARSLGFRIGDPSNRREVARALEASLGTPYQNAVHYGLLRSLAHARYSGIREGHYALAFPLYCHFTSPIRRYPDLYVHQMLDFTLAGRSVPRGLVKDLEEVGELASAMEVRAESAERELTEVLVLRYLADKVGRQYPGIVTGVEEFGIFVELVEIGIDGLLPTRLLPHDRYRYEKEGRRLVGASSGKVFHLGQELRVQVESVNVDRRFLDLRLAEEVKAAPIKRRRGKGNRR
ncbi:MAG: ribonuclease R [Planctomycetota bacterium]